MYRAVAYLALREGVATDDGASLAALAREARISFAPDGRIVAAERDVSEEIRRPAVSAAVSEVSAHAEVRDVLLDEQRRIGADPGHRDRGPRHRHRRLSRGAREALPDGLARDPRRAPPPRADRRRRARRRRRDAARHRRRATPTTRSAPWRRCAAPTTRSSSTPRGSTSTRSSKRRAASCGPAGRHAVKNVPLYAPGDGWFYRTVRHRFGRHAAARPTG